jgi:hypothetical protein
VATHRDRVQLDGRLVDTRAAETLCADGNRDVSRVTAIAPAGSRAESDAGVGPQSVRSKASSLSASTASHLRPWARARLTTEATVPRLTPDGVEQAITMGGMTDHDGVAHATSPEE